MNTDTPNPASPENETSAQMQRIASFLRKHAPPRLSGMDDEFFWRLAQVSAKSADELGIHTEEGVKWWALVMITFDGRAAELDKMKDYIRDSPGTPDERAQSLIKLIADAVHNRASSATLTEF